MSARTALFALLSLAAACSSDPLRPETDGGKPDGAAAVAAVEMDAPAMVMDLGSRGRLVATPKDSAGHALTGRSVQWTSSDPAIATVSSEASGATAGIVIARASGATTITATVDGKSATIAVTVLGDLDFDLLFDAQTGFQNSAQLWRLDSRTPGTAPTRVLPVGEHTSDVVASPDGRRLAFAANEGGQSDIFVVNRDGTGLVKITSSKDQDDQPSWSPDGSRIVFRRWNYIGVEHDLYVVNADGTGETNLTADLDGELRRPAWSPVLADGSRRIAFSRVTRGASGYMRSRILSMREDGSDKRPVTADTERLDDEAAWRPDGRAILFVRTGGEDAGDLWLIDPATGIERRLMAQDPASAQRSPAWSPDGALVTFTSAHEIIGNRSGDWQVYTVRADGTGLVRRTSDPVDHFNPVFARR